MLGRKHSIRCGLSLHGMVSVCVFFCLLVMSATIAKTDEPIEMPISVWILWNRVGEGETVYVDGARKRGIVLGLNLHVPRRARGRYSQPHWTGTAAMRPLATSTVATC